MRIHTCVPISIVQTSAHAREIVRLREYAENFTVSLIEIQNENASWTKCYLFFAFDGGNVRQEMIKLLMISKIRNKRKANCNM